MWNQFYQVFTSVVSGGELNRCRVSLLPISKAFGNPDCQPKERFGKRTAVGVTGKLPFGYQSMVVPCKSYL